jgi:hypothetical protein
MRKIFAIFALLIIFASTTFANLDDSIKTVYEDKEFKTQYVTKLKASPKVVEETADYLVTDFHNSPDNLFNWALKDLGLQSKNDEIVFVLQSSVTDIKTEITHGNFDIVVPHFTTFKNIKVDAIVNREKGTSRDIKVNADIIYSSTLLKNALGTITFIPTNNNEYQLITNVKIKFGWFFNIFITKKRYKSIVEWRIKKFTENVKAECLRRQNLEH